MSTLIKIDFFKSFHIKLLFLNILYPQLSTITQFDLLRILSRVVMKLSFEKFLDEKVRETVSLFRNRSEFLGTVPNFRNRSKF
jgi:hypothetical protein